jgi:N-sulfoglucosamine sulfohydrolase
MSQPNILYIHSHDTGRYIQPYGHAIPTPNLQQLAEDGILFRQAFCAAPTCSPSRASLLTGQYAHNNGMLGLAHRGFALNDYSQHIIHTLKQAGYSSALAGIQHVANSFTNRGAEEIGYDQVLGTEDPHNLAIDFIKHAPEQPFFLTVGFFETHREFPTEHHINPNYSMPPAPLPDTPRTRQDMANYKAMAQILDEKIGQVLQALDDNNLRDNTLIIYTTDHGIAFPSMKCRLTDAGIGVSLIMQGLELFTGGQVIDAMVSHIDLFPTLCDLLEIDPPMWLQGQSMLPLISDKSQSIREEVFAEVNYHAAYEPKRAVRTQQHKYIRRYDDRQSPVLPNIDDGLSKDQWLEHGLQSRVPASEQLYDLIFDPHETNNLATHPDYAQILADMQSRLARWMQDTDDPLLTGHVIAPSDAVVNDPDGLSPRRDPKPIDPTD